MGYLISELLIASGIEDNVELINEKEFDAFSRATSQFNRRSCVFVEEKKYIKKVLQQELATMVITNTEGREEFVDSAKGICICEKPKVVYFKLLDFFNRRHEEEDSRETIIGKGCQISKLAHVFENDVEIDDNVTIEDFAVIYPHTHIGEGSIIRSGAKIGVQDYNYYYEQGVANHIYHGGSVEIGKNTEIGINTCIGRALYIDNSTRVGDDCKISTNCGVGHDSHVGNRVMIYSGSMLGGNVIVEDDVHITLNCTVKNGLRIGKNATVCMGSNVFTNVREGIKVFGNPAKKMDL